MRPAARGPGLSRARWARARRALTGEAGPGTAMALAAVSLLIALIAVGGPREISDVQYSAQASALAQLPALDIAVTAQGTWLENQAGNMDLSADAGKDLAFLLAAAVRPVPLAPAGQWTSVVTPEQVIQNPAPKAVLARPPALQIVYRSDLAAYARTAAGKLPDTARLVRRPGQPSGALLMDAAVTTATASRLGLHVGSQVNLGSYQPARPPLLLRVTAIVAPRRPSSPFWQADSVLAAPVIPVSSPSPAFLLGEALVGPDELPILQSAFGGGFIHGEWFTPLDLAALDRAKLTSVLNHLHGLAATDGGTALEAELPSFGGAGTSSTLTVSSGIPDGLSGFLAQQQAADAVDTLLIADVLLAGLLLIATCARLVASAYGPELTVIRARGGSARQVAGRVLVRSACLAGLGSVAGAALALAITPTPPGGSAISWALGGLAAAAAIVIPALAAFWSHRGIRPAGDERADLASARPSRRRLIAELTVLVLAAAALAAVRLRGIGAGTDLFTQLAPVLAASAAALIAVRLYPVPVRGLLRVAAGRPGAVGFLALARAARARIGALLPVLTLVISLTLAAFGVMTADSVAASQDASAWRQAGADLTVQATGIKPVPATLTRDVAAMPGVRHVVAAYIAAGHAATLQAGGKTRPAGLVVVSPAAYAALANDTPWPDFPARALARGPRNSAAAAAVPVLASAGLRAGGGHGTLVVDGTRLPVRIAGTSGPTPAMTTVAFVVLPDWASARLPSVASPNTLLATGTGIRLPGVRAAVRRLLPGAQIRSRAQVLAGLRDAPAPRAGVRLYWLGTGVAALLSVIALLFGLAVSGPGRGQLIDRLLALGISTRQARALAVSEVLPLLTVAVLGTAIAGLALAIVLGPVMNLAVLSGTSGPVSLRPGLIAAVPAAGIVVVGLAIVAAQSAAFLSRNLAATLRREEAG
jgi:putative ABC transport system permease protein